MSDSMIKKLSSNEFNVEKFVKELSQHCVGGLELQQKRVEIGALAEETNSLLKKNVFHNYMLFIETAKEISHLEGEMYQLSHLLTEQRSLLATLAHTQIVEGIAPVNTSVATSNPEQDKDAENRKQLSDIMQKVEACPDLLSSPRCLVFEGDLTELDALDNKPIRRIHAYLLSDSLILACPSQQTSGRYQLNISYELHSLAVVNIRHIASAFKLLVFPDTRVFQAPSASIKKAWLDHMDAVKRGKVAVQEQKPEPVQPSNSGNPFDEVEDEEAGQDRAEEDSKHSLEVQSTPSLPDFIAEVGEDLDVLIVERHYDEALALVERARDYLNSTESTPQTQEVERKLSERVNTLTQMLTKALEVTPEKSLQGGLRSARPFIRVLNQLNKTALSCDLFLALCSSILKTQLKRVRRDGPTLNYVTSASTVFFTNLSLMTSELSKVGFPSTGQCAAAFVVWATREFNLFVSHVIRELFVTQSNISTLSPCIAAVRNKCTALALLGLDMRYLWDGGLRSPLAKVLKSTQEQLTDTIRLRCAEDSWRPHNLGNRQGRDKFLSEFESAGLTSMSSYLTVEVSSKQQPKDQEWCRSLTGVLCLFPSLSLSSYKSITQDESLNFTSMRPRGDCWLRLSHNTISFTRLYLSLLDDCINLATNDLLYNIEQTLYAVMQAQLKHVDESLRNDKLAEEREFIVQNADFIINNLLTVCEKKFQDHFQFKSKKLAQVRKEFQHLA